MPTASKHIDFDKLDQATRCLKALAHPIRLGILCSLQHGPQNVQSLVDALQTSQPNLSQHLSTMRDRNILTTKKQGNHVFYAVKDKRMFKLITLLQTIYCGDD